MSNHVRRLLGICVMAAASLAATSAQAQIHWRSGVSEGRRMSPQQTAAVIADYAAASQERHIVVQFDGAVNEADRALLGDAGLTLQNYVTDNAWFATIHPKGVNVALLARVQGLRDAQPINAKWKLHPSLLAGEVPTWAVVNQKPSASSSLRADETTVELPRVGTYVMFHADVDLDTKAMFAIHQAGGSLVSKITTINAIVAEVDMNRLFDLAEDDAVQWIEPALPAFVSTNDGARTLSGAGAAQTAPYNLNGAGVSVLVYDRGLVWDAHTDLFAGGVNIGFSEGFPVPASAHSTHVAGIIAGNGASSAGTFAGMAPGAAIVSYEADFETGFIAGSLYTDPGDMELDYAEAIGFFLTTLACNPMTTDLAANNFPCAWEGDYGVTASLIDRISRGSLHPAGQDITMVWSAGNERTDGGCGTSYSTLPPPAGAKNALTVGSVNTNDGSLAAGTSFGPTDDGRIKPDFVAPGSQVGGDGGITSTSSTNATGYTVMSGSSMAAASVTGLCALLANDYRAHYAGAEPLPSTLKVLLAQTAQDIEEAGPDFKSGFGSVRVVPAIDALRAGRFFESSVIQDGVHLFQVNVGPAHTQLKVTLAWDDPEGAPNAASTLVNDLDIKAFSPTQVEHFPLTLDPANPSAIAVSGGPDRRNNVEQIVVNNPEDGVWLIEVRGFNVPIGPQSFSVAGAPAVKNCASRGVVSLNQFFYNCDGTDPINIRVIDCDLNTNAGSAQTTSVSITTSHPGISAATQTVMLTETGADTADFRGQILFTTFPNSTTRLYYEPGDAITVTYNDANTGSGAGVSTSTGEIDCTPPVISNVQFTNILADRFTVTFQTDELARASAFAGTFCGDTTFVEGGTTYTTSHAITITGLDDETTYFVALFDIEDTAGNFAPTDDNGGLCYEVTTVALPDSFTEIFTAGADGFDLDNKRILFTIAGGPDFYDACVEDATEFNTPVAGTDINPPLVDDNFTQVNLVGGSVSLYGQSYNTLFVASNGRITFGAGSGTLGETIEGHLGIASVSALWDDLNPGVGGQVLWQELADRFVLTFDNVPEFGTTNTNSFQIEMYFDGDIAITYLSIAVQDCIVGLSPGTGLTEEFVEQDFLAEGNCGPRPPRANPQTREVLVNADTTITLVAIDDGLPIGVLDYIINTLPQGGLKDPGNNHVIVPGELPYTLINHGSQVVAHPTVVGQTTFQFRANDTGTPPQGGDSDNATVTLNVTVLAPTAANIATEVDENACVSIQLQGTDINNEVLTYTVLSLPNPGTLADSGNGNTIDSNELPYVLVNNGNTVQYCSPSFVGDVTFQYQVRDASNNTSNVAQVSVQVGQPDYLTELFDATGTFDLDNKQLTFVPDGSLDGYDICVEDITALPSPVAGTALAQGDDTNVAVTLNPPFSHFGIPRNQAFVASNGYITFVAGSNDFSESLAEHFGPNPHISGLYEDLDPGDGGQVLFQQLADRAVVTWNAVPEFAPEGPSNTFQIEMHTNGNIVLAYLEIASTDGIVGLSRGVAAVPVDFVESDMSGTGSCGPRPPQATSQAVQVAINGSQTVTLGATDDGLPTPPGDLVYIITDNIDLGTSTLRDAGNNALITNAMIPYTLVNGGNQVTYQASGGGLGADQLMWKANDGGVAPDGGDSNVASVAFEIGSTLISVTPDTNLVTSGQTGGPFAGTQDYLVTSQLPTAVMVRVSSPEPWISINGSASPLEFTLPNQGATSNVTVGLSAAANGLTPGLYQGTVNFQNLSTGAGTTSRTVTVDVGRQVYDQATNLPLSPVDNTPAGLTSTITVLDDICVGDIDFDFNMPHTWVGDLIVTLTHDGTTVVLIDRMGSAVVPPGVGCAQNDLINIRLDDEGTGGPIETQCAAAPPAATSPPSFTPNNPLSAWDGQTGIGDWVLNVSDNAGQDTGTLSYWALRISAGGPLCGPQASNVSVSVPTAVQTNIVLNGTGPGVDPLNYVIDTLPAHGTLRNTNNQVLAAGAVLPANGNTVRYTGAAAYHGADSFTYHVEQGGVNSNTATVSVDVGATLIAVTPADPFNAAGPVGGPFTQTFQYTVTSQLAEPVQVQVTKNQPWISINGGNGPITQMLNGVGASLVVNVSINASANSLANGDYDGMVTFTNLTTGAGNAARNVTLDVGAPSPQLVFNLDTNPGWSYGSGWAYGIPVGGGSGLVGNPGTDPTSGFTGSNVIGYNLTGNYTNNLPARNMTMRYSDGAGGFIGLDCSELSEVELHFRRWLGVESASFDHATVSVSTDNVIFTVIWENPVGPLVDTSWVPQVFDIASFADGESNVYIRFTMGPTDSSTVAFGWNLDDIEIWGVSSEVVTGGACCVDGACTDVASEAACTALGYVCDVAELLPPSFTGCFGDADGNGFVNAGDRGFVAVNIGATDPDLVCKFDIDGNGFVNAGDRGFVAVNIGLCTALPDYQDGSGLNDGAPDDRFGLPEFTSGSTCGTVTCD